jgi:hypothetical protein
MVRHPLRIKPTTKRPLRERAALPLPIMIRLGGAFTMRLPHRSRLRRSLMIYAARLVVQSQSRGDFALTTRLYAPDSELRNIPAGDAAVSILGLDDVYRGPAGVQRFFEQWAEPWEHWYWAREGQLVDVGNGRLLFLLTLVGQGRGSGIEIQEEVGILIEIKRGLAVRQRNWVGTGAWEEAIEAAAG